MNDLRNIAGAILTQPRHEFTEDGRLAVYAILKNADIPTDEIVAICTSDRTGGPTAAMIEAGDYSEFPYERAKGPIRKQDKTQLLLWDRETDEHGLRVVARADGSVRTLTEEEFQRAIAGSTGP